MKPMRRTLFRFHCIRTTIKDVVRVAAANVIFGSSDTQQRGMWEEGAVVSRSQDSMRPRDTQPLVAEQLADIRPARAPTTTFQLTCATTCAGDGQ